MSGSVFNNLKTFLITMVTLVTVNTVSEIIKRELPSGAEPKKEVATEKRMSTPSTETNRKTSAHKFKQVEIFKVPVKVVKR